MRVYFNLKTSHGVETVDEICSRDFSSRKEFIAEKYRLLNEYHIAGMAVYLSVRCTKEWRKK